MEPDLALPSVLTDPEIFETGDLTTDQIRTLDSLSYNAWHAEEVSELDGWLLRFSNGVTRRANSVYTAEGSPETVDDDLISEVETFYEGHALPSRFQISPATMPETLDSQLAEQGYKIEAPVDVQIVAVDDFDVGGIGADGDIEVDYQAREEWLELYQLSAGRDVSTIVERDDGNIVFPIFYDEDGEALGVAMGIIDGGWLGIFCMHVHPEARKYGVGTSLLMVLGEVARQNGCHGMYLQVEQDNEPAQNIYERAGFQTVYSYHYRTLSES